MKKLLYLYNDGHNAFPHIKGGAIFETYEDDDEGGEIIKRRDDGNHDDTNIYANNTSREYDDEVIGSVIYEPDGDRRVNYVMSHFTEADSDVIPSHRFNDDGYDIIIKLNSEIAQQAQMERERELYGVLDNEAVEFQDDEDDEIPEQNKAHYDDITDFKQKIANASTVNDLKQIIVNLNDAIKNIKGKLQKEFSETTTVPIKNATQWYKLKMSELNDYIKYSNSEKSKAYDELVIGIKGLDTILKSELPKNTKNQIVPEGKEIINNFFKSTVEKQIDKLAKDITTKKLTATEVLSKSRKLAPTLYNLVKREIESKNIKADIQFNKYIYTNIINIMDRVKGNDNVKTALEEVSQQLLITLAQNVLSDKMGALYFSKAEYLGDIQLTVDKYAKATDNTKDFIHKSYDEIEKGYQKELRKYISLENFIGEYEKEKVDADEKIKKIKKERVRKDAPMIAIPKEADPSIVREEKPTKKEGLSKSQKKKLKKEKQLDTAVSRLKTMVPHASGPLLEDYLSKDGSNILNMITEDKTPIINNMDNKNIPDVEVDINGEAVSLRSASTLDAYNNDNAFEIKNYKLNSQSDNIPIQLSKLQGTPIFTPYYLSNGRLYNIEVDVVDTNGVRHNKNIYPTNEKGRELYMIYKLNDGLYKYKPMEGEDVKLKAVQATTKGGKQLYVYHGSSLKPTIDIYGNKSLIVPRDKLIKI